MKYFSPRVDCRPWPLAAANGSLSAGNIRRIFGGIFEMMCVEWYTTYRAVGLHTAVKPLLSHSTTGEFNSPPTYLRTMSTARTLDPC
eukprot:1190545-Prorocentrum_minimum.AAC.1